MPDKRQQLQQLLDHPTVDGDPPPAPAFTAAVMARVRAEAQPATRPARALPWVLAAGALVAAALISASAPGEALDPGTLLADEPAVDTLVELLVVSALAGALLLARRRNLA